MGVRKLVTRLMNIGYIAGAALATWGIAANPLLKVGVGVTLPAKDTLALVKNFVPGGGDSTETLKPMRDLTIDEVMRNPMILIQYESITNGVFDKLGVELSVELPSLIDYLKVENEKKPLIFNTTVEKTVKNFTDGLIDQLGSSFNTLTKNIAKFTSSLVVGSAIKTQIENVLPKDGDVDGAFANVTDEQINSVVDSVWNAMESGDATVDSVVQNLQGSVNDVLLTLATSDNNEGFVDSSGNPIQISSEDLGPIKDSMNDMLGRFELIDDDGKIKDISAAMNVLIGMIPGLGGDNKITAPTSLSYDNSQKKITWAAVEGASKYKVTINDADAVEVETTSYDLDASVGTFTIKVVTVPSDSAKTESDATELKLEDGVVVTNRTKRATRDGSSDQVDVSDQLAPLIDQLTEKIPFDKIQINLDELVGKKIGIQNFTTIAYAGLCGLAALPWVLFIIFTLIRTLKFDRGNEKKKFWAKPWFIFVFAFLELIFGGIGLFLLKPIDGLQYVKPIILQQAFAQGEIPNTPLKIATLIEGASLTFSFHTVMAAAVYLIFIPYTIVYMVFAHSVKKEYKIWKKAKALAKKISKGKMEFKDVKEKYQKETAKILAEKYDINVEAA